MSLIYAQHLYQMYIYSTKIAQFSLKINRPGLHASWVSNYLTRRTKQATLHLFLLLSSQNPALTSFPLYYANRNMIAFIQIAF